MIHFHGGPITPIDAAVTLWTRRHAMVSFEYPSQTALAFEICQTVRQDCGAFTKFQQGKGKVDLPAYADWVLEWIRHPANHGHLIPDDITGDDSDNDKLISQWLQHMPRISGGIPVWHLHESLDRLKYLITCVESRVFPEIAIGSSGQWSDPGTDAWWIRIGEAMEIACDEQGRPRVKMHGLRMLSPTIFSHLPLASADSCNVALNCKLDKKWTGAYQPITEGQRALVLAERIELHAAASKWSRRHGIQQSFELIG